MPSKPDLSFFGLEEFMNEPIVSKPTVKKHVVETSKAKVSADKPKVVRKNNGAPIIEDWVSDSKEEDVPQAKIKKKTVKPNFAKIEFVKSKEQVKSPRKKIVKQGSNFEIINKACYVCGSFDHLQYDCNNHQTQFNNKKMVKPVWNYTQKVNHQNYSRMTHPSPKRNMVPKAVLMRSGLVSLTTARPVNTAQPRTTVNSASPMTNRVNTVKDKNVNAARPKIVVNVVRPKAVLNAVKGNQVNVVKASACWVWKPKTKIQVSDGLGPQKKLIFLTNVQGNPQMDLQDQGVIDNGCSRHMTGNMSYLTDYEELLLPFHINTVSVSRYWTDKEFGSRIEQDASFKWKLTDCFWFLVLNVLNRFKGSSLLEELITKKCLIEDEDFVKRSYLELHKEIDGGYVAFGGNLKGGKITRKGDDEKKVTEELGKEGGDSSKDSESNDQEKEDNVNNTNTVNAASTNEVNTVDDDEDVGAEADMNNLDAFIPVSPILTTRIYKDHPVEQIIRDLNSTPQTRRMTKNLEEHGLFKSVQQRTNHKDFQNCLFACFLSQEEPKKMDVKSAFLYGKIEEEVYVCQPPRFEDSEFPDRVYKVEKTLYRLHQAPRVWYETLSTYLLENGFQRGKIDKTLFIRRDKGLQVKQKKDGISISQDKYVTEILKKFGFTDVKTASTPMETQNLLLKDEDGEEWCYACARYQVNTKILHLHAVKRIFRDCNEKKLIHMVKIHTDKNVADLLTKAFDNEIGVNAGDSKLMLLGINLLLLGKVNVARHKLTAAVEKTKIKKDTEAPQPSGPTTNVADEVVYEERDDSLEMAATTTTGLDAEQDRGAKKPWGIQLLRLGMRIYLNFPMIYCSDTKTAQAQEITSLKLSVKKLEKKGGSRTHKLKRLYKVDRSTRIVSSDEASLGDQEDASKQGRKIDDIDKDAEITLVDETQGRYGDDIMFDVSDLAGEEVFVAEQGVSDKDVNLSIDDVTLAQALAALKSAKVQEKANVIEELRESITTTPTLTTITAATTITTTSTRPKAKGLETAKVDNDQEAAKIKELMEIVLYKEEVAIDVIPLAVKPPSIMYLVFSHMLKSFDREDLETLWKLVKAKHGSTRPEEGYERVLWGDLKMFEPHVEDTVWRNQQDYRVLDGKIFDYLSSTLLRMTTHADL
ncbi:putative ribonuclease H-like domain-containing protein [Tanacetum coccineum]